MLSDRHADRHAKFTTPGFRAGGRGHTLLVCRGASVTDARPPEFMMSYWPNT